MQSTKTFMETIAEFTASRTQLMALWREGIPSFCPEESQWIVWQQVHDPHNLMRAVLQTIKKFRKNGGNMSGDYLTRYASSVANQLKREQAETKSISGGQ